MIQAVAANDIWQQDNQAVDHILTAGISQTTEEANEIGMLENALNTYISKNALLFITGERPSSELSTFAEELAGLNLAQILEIKQAAYDRFLAR